MINRLGLALLLLSVVAIVWIGYYIVNTEEVREGCQKVTFVQAVGHRNSTTYIYKLEKGSIIETETMIGDYCSVIYRKFK